MNIGTDIRKSFRNSILFSQLFFIDITRTQYHLPSRNLWQLKTKSKTMESELVQHRSHLKEAVILSVRTNQKLPQNTIKQASRSCDDDRRTEQKETQFHFSYQLLFQISFLSENEEGRRTNFHLQSTRSGLTNGPQEMSDRTAVIQNTAAFEMPTKCQVRAKPFAFLSLERQLFSERKAGATAIRAGRLSRPEDRET